MRFFVLLGCAVLALVIWKWWWTVPELHVTFRAPVARVYVLHRYTVDQFPGATDPEDYDYSFDPEITEGLRRYEHCEPDDFTPTGLFCSDGKRLIHVPGTASSKTVAKIETW